MPEVEDTIFQLRDIAKESYRQMKANADGTRTKKEDDDPDHQLRRGVTINDLEDPGDSILGKADWKSAFRVFKCAYFWLFLAS